MLLPWVPINRQMYLCFFCCACFYWSPKCILTKSVINNSTSTFWWSLEKAFKKLPTFWVVLTVIILQRNVISKGWHAFHHEFLFERQTVEFPPIWRLFSDRGITVSFQNKFTSALIFCKFQVKNLFTILDSGIFDSHVK